MNRDRRYPGARHGATPRSAHRNPAQHVVTFERVLAMPLVDRILRRPLRYPRALQVSGVVVGAVMILLALRPLLWPAAPMHVAAPPPTLVAPLAAGAASGDAEAVLGVVAAYNQASITAAILGRVDVLAPYLAPDGTTWAEVQAEYQRRATRGETHDPALTRWGVLRTAVNGDTATVETQEQWDDVTSVGGQAVSSKRGILIRATYTLRRSPSLKRWLITNVASTTIVN